MTNNIIELKKELNFCKKRRAFAIKMALEYSQKIKELYTDFDKGKITVSKLIDRLAIYNKRLHRYKMDALFWREDMQELLSALKGCI